MCKKVTTAIYVAATVADTGCNSHHTCLLGSIFWSKQRKGSINLTQQEIYGPQLEIYSLRMQYGVYLLVLVSLCKTKEREKKKKKPENKKDMF